MLEFKSTEHIKNLTVNCFVFHSAAEPELTTLSWKLQQQEKKVQAMRLHPSSNFPISGLKLIEKQIF